MPSPHLDRAFLAFMKIRGLDAFALKALRTATHLLSLAIGQRIAELRESHDPLQRAASEVEEASLLLRLSQETSEILAARWNKVPKKNRPHYTPEQRYRILRIKDFMALSRQDVARMFGVDVKTIGRWEAEAVVDPSKETVGSLGTPEPPVRRYADVVRGVVQSMHLAGFGGDQMIASALARAGWRVSKRTVGRISKEQPLSPPQPPSAPQDLSGRAVRARHPNHVLLMDITEIPSTFRIFSFKVLMVMDLFSRMPLAARITNKEPSAQIAIEVFRSAVDRNGVASHLVTDRGSQFTAGEFRQVVEDAGAKQRFGAVGTYGSIAIIERAWRSLKELLGTHSPFSRPLTPPECQRQVELALIYYAYCRPHSALGGASPAEIYFGIRPAHLTAVQPPRGRPGEGDPESPLEIVYLDQQRRLPMLLPKAA